MYSINLIHLLLNNICLMYKVTMAIEIRICKYKLVKNND